MLFFSQCFLAFAGIWKGVFYLVSKARLGGERRKAFASSHLDVLYWFGESPSYTFRLLLSGVRIRCTFLNASLVSAWLSCCWCFTSFSFPASSQFPAGRPQGRGWKLRWNCSLRCHQSLYHQPKAFQGRFGPYGVQGRIKGPFSHTLVPVLPFGFAFAAGAAWSRASDAPSLSPREAERVNGFVPLLC